jgi:hypothetical protein
MAASVVPTLLWSSAINTRTLLIAELFMPTAVLVLAQPANVSIAPQKSE